MNEKRAIEDVLAAGLRWLYETEQPESTILQPHGTNLLADRSVQFPAINRPRLVHFVPSGWQGQPVVVVDIANNEYDSEGRPLHRLLPEEMRVATGMLRTLGEEVVHTWNGPPADTLSLALKRPAHRSLLAAVNRYRKGCPEHPERSVFCKCGWIQRGRDLLVMPAVDEEV